MAAVLEGVDVRKTALHDFHVDNGGYMASFAGYMMPMSYGNDSIDDVVRHCRSQASLFDISYACCFTIHGKGAIPFLEGLVVADIAGMMHHRSILTLFTDHKGGILDDAILTKISNEQVMP